MTIFWVYILFPGQSILYMKRRQVRMERSLYSVSDLCTLCGITRKTLFYYDRIGLLKPAARTGSQNFKMYAEEQVSRLMEIRQYRDAGLNLSEIRQILDDPDAERDRILKGAMKRLEKELREKEDHIRSLKQLME